jgi:hypothetical protein
MKKRSRRFTAAAPREYQREAGAPPRKNMNTSWFSVTLPYLPSERVHLTLDVLRAMADDPRLK